MRTYELMFVLDPRTTDDEVRTITDDYKRMLTAGGAQILKEEQMGRRKLAYEIEKLTEGKYVLLHLANDGGSNPLAEVEHRMRQNDKVLRFLTVRTDEDLRRAGLPLPTAEQGAAEEGGEPAGDGGDAGEES